jgi:capsular polysaccharide biosynthesis protein
MESGRLWSSIARHWLLTSFVLLIVLAGAVAAAYLPKRSYEATGTLALLPSATSTTANTQLAQAVVGNYLAVIDSATTEATIRGTFTGPEATVAWKATSDNQPGTLVIRVHVTSQDSAVVAHVANAYVKYVGDLVTKAFPPITQTSTTTTPPTPKVGTTLAKPGTTTTTVTGPTEPAVSTVVLDDARTPTSPVSPNRPLLLGAGFILALVLASCAALLAGNKPRRSRVQTTRAVTPVASAAPGPTGQVEAERTAEPIRG